MVPSDTPEPALELFRRLIEIPMANVSYADITSSSPAILSNCAPVTKQAEAAISPQVGLALIMLIFVLFGSVVFLYQEVRSLRGRLLGPNGPDSPSGHNARDGEGGFGSGEIDNKIDVSERDVTVHVGDADASKLGEIELMRGQTNSSAGASNEGPRRL